jgi:hypothetical protein
MYSWVHRNRYVLSYVVCMAAVLLGYVRYDPYQLDGDAISYMDIATSLAHRRWHEAVNGLWNPGYPAVLAIAEKLNRFGKMQELQALYWVNYVIFLGCIGCTWFFVRGILHLRARNIASGQEGSSWVLPDSLVYLASFSIVLLSWLHEFSPGKIRVDGLFASLLLLAFGSLVRSIDSRSFLAYFGSGSFFGLAYLVKSPGLVIAIVALLLLILVLYRLGKLKDSVWKLALAWIAFLVTCGPYIAALSLQKHRFDTGDSARLNYAWLVAGTEPQHLLNNQPARFGNSFVKLKHSEAVLMSNPIIVSFNRFPHATDAFWFDPSYFNEGIAPRFSFIRQARVIIEQSHHLFIFVVNHSYIFSLLVLSVLWGARPSFSQELRLLAVVFYCLFAFCVLMYLSVHFLDRYIAGLFWPACIVTLAFFTTSDNWKRGMTSGAAVFMALAILLSGVQNVIRMRQAAIFSGKTHGWYSTEEFGAAKKLAGDGIPAGSVVTCFRACNTGPYWARLAGVRITSEIYDPKYMSDTEDGNSSWDKLPNKAEVFLALKATGSKGIVGDFEHSPPSDEGWEHLAGLYYFHPL